MTLSLRDSAKIVAGYQPAASSSGELHFTYATSSANDSLHVFPRDMGRDEQ